MHEYSSGMYGRRKRKRKEIEGRERQQFIGKTHSKWKPPHRWALLFLLEKSFSRVGDEPNHPICQHLPRSLIHLKAVIRLKKKNLGQACRSLFANKLAGFAVIALEECVLLMS